MAELLLVANPKKRRRKNPKHRARRRRHNPHHKAHRARRRRHNPHVRHHMRRRRRHNPTLRGLTSGAMPILKEGFIGASGALANDALFGFVTPYLSGFLGANAANGFVQFGLKLASALATGWVAKFARLPGRELAVGAATVASHDFLKAQLQSMAPNLFGPGGTLALSGYNGFGAYLSGSAPLVGTATFPATYLPQSTTQPGFGAYLSGSSGAVDGSGVYSDDAMGYNYWDGGGN